MNFITKLYSNFTHNNIKTITFYLAMGFPSETGVSSWKYVGIYLIEHISCVFFYGIDLLLDFLLLIYKIKFLNK